VKRLLQANGPEGSEIETPWRFDLKVAAAEPKAFQAMAKYPS
jgi:hypothetical protein